MVLFLLIVLNFYLCIYFNVLFIYFLIYFYILSSVCTTYTCLCHHIHVCVTICDFHCMCVIFRCIQVACSFLNVYLVIWFALYLSISLFIYSFMHICCPFNKFIDWLLKHISLFNCVFIWYLLFNFLPSVDRPFQAHILHL